MKNLKIYLSVYWESEDGTKEIKESLPTCVSIEQAQDFLKDIETRIEANRITSEKN